MMSRGGVEKGSKRIQPRREDQQVKTNGELISKKMKI
jgi:hypothetical protein